jgi:hypothetical protein
MFQVVDSPQEEALLHNHSQTHLLALSTTCVIPHKDLGPTFNNFGCLVSSRKTNSSMHPVQTALMGLGFNPKPFTLLANWHDTLFALD